MDGSDSTFIVDMLLQVSAARRTPPPFTPPAGQLKPVEGRARTKHDRPEPLPKGATTGDPEVRRARARGLKPPPPPPLHPRARSAAQIVPVLLHLVHEISSIRIFIPKDLQHQTARLSAAKSLREVLRRFPDGPALLDPVEDMKITDESFVKVRAAPPANAMLRASDSHTRARPQMVRKVEGLEERVASHKWSKKKEGAEQELAAYSRYLELDKRGEELAQQIKNASRDVALLQTLKSMKRVLRRCGAAEWTRLVSFRPL